MKAAQKKKPLTAKGILFVDPPQVVPPYREPIPKHFTQRVAQVARDLPGSRAHLVEADHWKENAKDGTVITLCGEKCDQKREQLPFALAGLKHRLCQACAAEGTRARIVKWRGGSAP